MLKTSQQIRDEVADLRIASQAIVDLAKEEERDFNQEEQAQFDKNLDLIDRLESEDLPRAERREKLEEQAKQARKLQDKIDSGHIPSQDAIHEISVPARARVHRKLSAFDNERDAYVSGQAILGGIFGNARSKEWCVNHGIMNAQVELDNTLGGFLVPDEMQRSLVRLREERGVAPRYARSYPMSTDNVVVPRQLGDVTSYWVGENQEITASDTTLGGAELTARKLACLTKVSTELDEDAVIDVAEMVVSSMAYSMASAVDDAYFNGDGTSTYGMTLGLKNALHANAIFDAATGSLAVTDFGLTDFEQTIAKVAQYPGAMNRWFMHSAIFWNGPARLQDAAGGNNVQDLGGGPVMQFLGYPVTFVQTMPSTTTDTASTILAYFGDLSLASTSG